MGEVINLHKKPRGGHEGLELTKGQILDMSHDDEEDLWCW